MHPVHDMFPCTILSTIYAAAAVPAGLKGLATDRTTDWAQAERSGRSEQRPFSRSV